MNGRKISPKQPASAAGVVWTRETDNAKRFGVLYCIPIVKVRLSLEATEALPRGAELTQLACVTEVAHMTANANIEKL